MSDYRTIVVDPHVRASVERGRSIQRDDRWQERSPMDEEEAMQGGPLKQCTCGTGPCGGIHAKWCDLWWQPARPRWHDLDPADRPIIPWEAFALPALIGFALGVLAGYLLYVLMYA